MIEQHHIESRPDAAALAIAANLVALARGAVFALAFAAASTIVAVSGSVALGFAAMMVGFVVGVGLYRAAGALALWLRSRGAGVKLAWWAKESVWAAATAAMCAAAGNTGVWQAAIVVWAVWAALGVVAWMRGLRMA